MIQANKVMTEEAVTSVHVRVSELFNQTAHVS